MPRIDDVYPSKWFRAADLRDQPGTFTIDFVEVGTVGDKSQLIVTFRETEKPLGLNKTNASAIASIYGNDTDDWIGESVVLFPTQVDFQGQMVEAIRVNEKQTRTILQNKLRAQKQAGGRPAAPAATKAAPITQKELAAQGLEPVADEDIPF